MFRKQSLLFLLSLLILTVTSCKNTAGNKNKKKPPPRKVAYTANFNDLLSLSKMKYAKSVGIDYVKISTNPFRMGLKLKNSEEQMKRLMKQAKANIDSAGIKVWSVHMPFGKDFDLSLKDEEKREQVVDLSKQILDFIKILKPQIINFHPSWYLGVGKNERKLRREQFVKSVQELVNPVSDIGAKMTIENEIGYTESKHGPGYQEPLCHTTKECKEMMNSVPEDVYFCVDMNHSPDPVKLIQVFGKRVKQLHVSDGYGKATDLHYFPCSGNGNRNWVKIQWALYKVGYSGPWTYEVHHKYYDDLKELTQCYDTLYHKFINAKF